MLEDHHRAVYMAHSQLRKSTDRCLYFIVSRCKDASNQFVMVVITCTPTASKRDLVASMPPDYFPSEVQIFKSRGNEIERVKDGRGRYCDDSVRDIHRIELAPLPLAA